MGEAEGPGEAGTAAGKSSEDTCTVAAGDVADAHADSASARFAAVRSRIETRARPEDVVLLQSVIEALRAGGVEHALGEVCDAAEGGALEEAVLLVPTVETIELDTNATLASLGPGGSWLNTVLLKITRNRLFTLLLPLTSVLYAVTTHLYWAEQVEAGWVVLTLALVIATFSPIFGLCNVRAVQVLVGSFENIFFLSQTVIFTICGALLLSSATRQALWVIPGVLFYMPFAIVDANPDRSSQFLAYIIGSSGFAVGIFALCFHLWVYEDRVVEVLGVSISLASRTISSHFAMMVFGANLAWRGLFHPQVLAGRPEISYVWVPRNQADIRKSIMMSRRVRDAKHHHQQQQQQSQHKILPSPANTETGLAAMLAVSLRELQLQVRTECKSGDAAHAALNELEAIYRRALHRNRSPSAAHRHDAEGLVLLLAPTFLPRRVNTSETLASLLGGQCIHRMLSRTFRNALCRMIADALWPVGMALAVAGATGSVEPELTTVATAALLAVAFLEVLLVPREVGHAILFGGNALLMYVGVLSVMLAVNGVLVMQDARARFWPQLMCLPLIASFTDALPSVHSGSPRRFLQLPSLSLMLWVCAYGLQYGQVRQASFPMHFAGGLTIDAKENMVPGTVMLALLCTRMGYRAIRHRNELTARVGMGKLTMEPHLAVKLLASHRGLRDLTIDQGERARLTTSFKAAVASTRPLPPPVPLPEVIG
jgi:hypothetical protein